VAIFRVLVNTYPDRYRIDLNLALSALARVLDELGRSDVAESTRRRIVQLRDAKGPSTGE
jgi:hypothetical protein